jgi:hypothetical protein
MATRDLFYITEKRLQKATAITEKMNCPTKVMKLWELSVSKTNRT